MGRRSRRRQREALRRVPPQPAPPPAVYDSGLLKGQTQPVMREQLQRIGKGLRARYGPVAPGD